MSADALEDVAQVSGKVLSARTGELQKPEEQRVYEVQITRYFRRTDLMPVDEEDPKPHLE
jgi:hypothetical protein